MDLMFFTPDGPQDLSRKTSVPTGFCKPPNSDKPTEIPGNLPVARVFRPMDCERSRTGQCSLATGFWPPSR